MTIPTATYRIQFRDGMTFDRAARLVPYLKKLGVSHLYASPIFTATTHSTHGYDVTRATQIDPALGGRAGFDRLVQALQNAGLGLILDIVPNHMAASLENPWWRDVIAHGEHSRYAHFFDIDWSRPLTLPFLGTPFSEALEKGEISVKADPLTGLPAFAYYDNVYPLTLDSWQGLNLQDKVDLTALHERQPYRLMSWTDAPRDLSYRRFFEITGLVGVRVEDPEVFDATHQLILELVHSGAVNGLRIDHIDGLADPKGYLTRLRQQVGPACYITVEKILAGDEALAADWPVSGTTGYEFIAALADALVAGPGIQALRHAYNAVTGKSLNMDAELRAAKALMVDRNFAGEFTRLLALAQQLVATDSLENDLRELLLAFPVYRTYATAAGLPATDDLLLQKIVAQIGADTPLTRLFRGTAPDDATALFRTRFQQLSGPLMAKSVEDTLFFRQSVALALNEVGAEPLAGDFSPTRFHRAMQARQQQQPAGLSSTSTHDTKRGEDARARLYALSEAPERWAAAVARWRQLHQPFVRQLRDGPAPEPAVEWLLYQALAGVWPVTLKPDDAPALQALETRFIDFVEKALREAKLRTDWAEDNQHYEQTVLAYARQLLSPDNPDFLQDFTTTLQPFIHAGLANSLSQTLIKLVAPGVPDIYQGSEALNFSLVDPDNRQPPDFARLQQMLAESPPYSWLNGQIKQQAIAALLSVRQQHAPLFDTGAYLPLATSRDDVIAFARTDGDAALLVVVPRLPFTAFQGQLPHPLPRAPIDLPASLTARRYRDVLQGGEIDVGDTLISAEPYLVLFSSSQ
ncbi:malto-oligosyltrehalose synthase [Pantoea phytobeneficialis]|uniref:Malto-oligosyltrehalose synthase n=1 Tax=Pantoea phytobeneficialis TaxID=2052056 RepID=A0AAP9H9F7_9GAMM|nr:malto-oligosyltrehalose synthase [Pantoea phytobeneficialis]MDO6406715.1 malto-oligosyltrehalose synthase [Pantoea phytobeneficialis]QGR09245.1 malto-oligosyltrehalose synthase [Pantoea phytobeneficialis]